ncbi:MAG: tyrosine-type recombinase/integrase [Thermoguttaceae bacterium]|jgi:integrase
MIAKRRNVENEATESPCDWHRRPESVRLTYAKCPLCGCPQKGTAVNGVEHRAVAPAENIPFRYLLRRIDNGWTQKAICPIAPGAVQPQPGPDEQTLSLIARAAALVAGGRTAFQAQQTLGLHKGRVSRWTKTYPAHWQAALKNAESQFLEMVRSQIGTAAARQDPNRFTQDAETAERIAQSRGETLTPDPKKTTLTSFFETTYVNLRLSNANRGTLKNYRLAMKFWQLMTGDPPLEKITAATLASYRDALGKRRGLRPTSRASRNTVRHKMILVQTVLDLAGPAGRGHRDGAGILASVPWIRAPKALLKAPREIPASVLKQVYLGAAGMDVPQIAGIKPPAWWRAILLVAYNTQLRRRTLFEMGMQEIDWPNHRIILPAERLKSGRPMIVHLNPAALAALQEIRTDRELVFPWPFHQRYFDACFHRLQEASGIAKRDWFGLHTIRATAATVLAGESPQAAQLALGHMRLSTTATHYIRSEGIVERALDAMPQPWQLG